LLSILKIGYFQFDYFVGWWIKVRPLLVRSTLVIFDRYYHDLLVDPRRYRYGGPVWLARWVGKLIRKPDLWILLDAPPEVLQDRKQEVPLHETTWQRQAYLDLVQGFDNAVVVDASQPLETVVADVNSAIVKYMVERTHKRLGL
jgi:thymidylate kinase